MIRVVLLGLSVLAVEPPDKRPAQEPPEAVAAKPESAEALAKYNAKKAQTPNTAAAQWRLAEWCDQNGLEAEAFVHYAAVIQLDPKRDSAWRKLGYKKHQGRWMTDAQIAEEAEQTKANKEWDLRLRKIHKDVHRGPKKAEALAALEAISDPRAVQAVYREFGARGPIDQGIAIQVFGQIDTPLSSKVLALMAIYGKSAEVRRCATEILRQRDPNDYLPTLVSLMSDPVKYEVRPVGGPGSPGVLFVEGERANVRRFYAPSVPYVRWQPGDIVTYDQNGVPAINRPFATMSSKLLSETGTKKTGTTSVFLDQDLAVRVSATDLMIEAQKGAIAAQAQLEADVRQIEALNTAQKAFNDTVMTTARDASGKDLGKDPKDWRDALADKGQYNRRPKQNRPKATLDELLPPAYVPHLGDLAFLTAQRTVTVPPDN